MPFQSPEDVPEKVKAFWRNIEATDKDKRQWIEVFNSCFERHKSEGLCFRMANGVLKKKNVADNKNNTKLEYVQNSIFDGTSLQYVQTPYGLVLQIPAILTREGVHNGFFKDFEEIRATVWTANGIPVTREHPHVSIFSSSASKIEDLRGFISEPFADEADRTLKGKVNIFDTPDNKKLIEEIQMGHRLDGSVGFYTDEFEANGEFNGIKYEGVEINIVYDHYAILETGHGACSQVDGCGLGLNKKDDGDEGKDKEPDDAKHGECPDGMVWNPDKEKCVPEEEEKEEEKAEAESSIDYKKETVLQEIRLMGFDDEDISEMDLDYDAIYYFVDCAPCSGAEDGLDAVFYENVAYTFSPPWSKVDKSKLLSSAFMVVGDPEKKTTWKLPYKYKGKVHCGAIRAIRQVLAGARGGVKLTPEQRKKAKSLSDRHWAACQKIREKMGGDEMVSIPVDDINTILYLVTDKDNEEVQAPINENDETKDLYINEDINTNVDKGVNMPEDIETSETEDTEVLEAIERLTSERDEAILKVSELESKLEEIAEAERKEKAEAIAELRARVVSLNEGTELYDAASIEKMDEEDLTVAEYVFGRIPTVTKNDLKTSEVGTESEETSRKLLPGVLPLTVGQLYKQVPRKKSLENGE